MRCALFFEVGGGLFSLCGDSQLRSCRPGRSSEEGPPAVNGRALVVRIKFINDLMYYYRRSNTSPRLAGARRQGPRLERKCVS